MGLILKKELESKGFDVEILERSGISLLDIMSDVDELVIVDSIVVDCEEEIGRVFEVDLKSFSGSHVKTPHTLSLDDALEVLRMLDLNPPQSVHVIGIGIGDVETISDELSERLKIRLPEICDSVMRMIELGTFGKNI